MATEGTIVQDAGETCTAESGGNGPHLEIELTTLNGTTSATDVPTQVASTHGEEEQETSLETPLGSREAQEEPSCSDAAADSAQLSDTTSNGPLLRVTGPDSVDISPASSNESIVCRICQLSQKETGEPMTATSCDCRGGLESVHRSCLIQWVTYKRNNKCELCGVVFPSVSPPPRTTSMERQQRRIEAVYQQYSQLRPMTRRKRAFLGSLSLFLVITTSATGILTVSTEREFHRIDLDPWSTGQARMDSYITFSICLSFLLFCATLTVGVLLVWLALEGSYFRRRQRFYAFANRLAQQESALGMYTQYV
ncbi:E3 ubiquitin-protein ligase MARCHF1-like [Haliotis rufescens]|uniref:E3 ubiquitin-protein ligase MARCHF1-like n=1 Tax=Haliotis rufescens TaxID=6454 RepID=UPI001EAFF554|nr:E3 ubiquitin-protein ligase MARCHF1-like [Haliotis rufescens]